MFQLGVHVLRILSVSGTTHSGGYHAGSARVDVGLLALRSYTISCSIRHSTHEARAPPKICCMLAAAAARAGGARAPAQLARATPTRARQLERDGATAVRRARRPAAAAGTGSRVVPTWRVRASFPSYAYRIHKRASA